MFGIDSKQAIAMTTLAGMLVAGITLILPNTAQAQYAEMLSSPGGGQGTRTLRTPLIPNAPYTSPYNAPFQGQPPPIGDGNNPRNEIRGDLGAPQGVYSGVADPTHGNMFPTRGGQDADGPENYVPDAGRRQTVYGQQQGMFEFGQGQQNGQGRGPGGKNGGPGLMNNGGPADDATGRGAGGKNGGTGWVNNGGPADDATGRGAGGKNGGTGWVNNGGPADDATGRGGGGRSEGTGWVNNGGPADDATGRSGGGKIGGGRGIINDGGASQNATGQVADGKRGGVGVVNNGGPANNGTGRVNNGGPRGNAAGTGDRLFQHDQQPNRYDFQGPLPTVRTFARYLVILGVVSATVFMAMATWAMVMGSQYGGSRVMGAASGLVLLLAGYTIWKVVQMNTFHANSTGYESHYRDGTPQNNPGPGTPQPSNGPFVPPQNPNSGPQPNGGPQAGNPNGGPQASNPNGSGPIPNPPGSPFGPSTAPGN